MLQNIIGHRVNVKHLLAAAGSRRKGKSTDMPGVKAIEGRESKNLRNSAFSIANTLI